MSLTTRLAAIVRRDTWAALWQALFALPQVAEPVAGRIRARQLQAVLRLAPVVVFTNAMNVLIVVAAFWDDASRPFLLAWGAGVILLISQALRAWVRWRRSPARDSVSPRALRRAQVNGAILAAAWAAAPLMLFPSSSGDLQLLIATVITGMICAGGFVLATIPAAGTTYVLVLGSGALASVMLSDYPLAWLVAALLFLYSGIVVINVWLTARLFNGRLAAEADAERQSEVIGVLLRDFEEHASDVLWETDARGHLCHVSPKLQAMFRLPLERLGGAPVLEVLAPLAARAEEPDALETLRQRFESRLPFRDLPIALQGEGPTRWWSLSAKPLLDGQGRFGGWRGVAADITERQRATGRLAWMAHHDALTGLANRQQFRAQVTECFEQHGGRPFAVLCLDLDHFKNINDTLGHAFGDRLLEEVARRLLGCTRRGDTVARMGGDEFAILVRQVDGPDEVAMLAQRLLQSLQTPCEVDGVQVSVRTSIGIALAPQDGAAIEDLLNHADLAMYAAKSAGRGAYRFFEAGMAALTRRRLQLEQGLRGALDRGEFGLVYQPQVDLASWTVTGFEALLRWRHPELGEVSPAEFIPVAEDSGLIQALGDWVVRGACLEAMRWPSALAVAVNVSPVQTLSDDLGARVQAALLVDSGLPAARLELELELTESVFLTQSPSTMQTLRTLHGLGLKMALDDFGIGYSSLEYLRRFPFDTLKVDRSFVRELDARHDVRAIVEMTVGLARTLGMKTVAEGVEQLAQAQRLRGYGCDAMQGFLVARPMPPQDIAAFLERFAASTPLSTAASD